MTHYQQLENLNLSISRRIEEIGFLTREQFEKEGWKAKDGSRATYYKGNLGINFNDGIIEEYGGRAFKISNRKNIPSIRLFEPDKQHSGTYIQEFYIGDCPTLEAFHQILKQYT